MVEGKNAFLERELTEEVLLCDSRGRLNREAIGWSRRPLHSCNLSGNHFRKKRWNYWCVTTERFLFSATVSNIDYLGLTFIYFLDFESKFFHELTVVTPFGHGCNLPNTVAEDVVFGRKGLDVRFVKEREATRISVYCADFAAKPLTVELMVASPGGHETLNVVIPWSDKRFQFTSKQNTLPVTGKVNLGDTVYDAEGGYACLDYGRGVWPYSSFWNWAGASGRSGGHTIGLNFGAGWTDGTGFTENGICIDGVLSKIGEELVFEYDSKDFKRPWAIRTAQSKQVAVRFEPFYERVARTDIKFLRSEVHQLIGRYSGVVVDDRGREIRFENIVGWAEEHFARW